MSIQIQRLAGIEQYTRDLARTRSFYVERMGLAEIGRSPAGQESPSQHESRVFRAGNINVICSSPRDAGRRGGRYLGRQADGIGRVVVEVADIGRAFRRVEHNGATPLAEI